MHLSQLIDGMLDLTRIETEKLDIKQEIVVLDDVVRHSLSLITYQLENKKLQLSDRV